MKKVIFPFTFAILFGFTSQHALCMQEEQEQKNREALQIRLKQLEEEHEKESQKNYKISSQHHRVLDELIERHGMSRLYSPYPQTEYHSSLIASNTLLSEICSRKKKIKILLGLESETLFK
ncbi:MAG: hypothetical protein KBD76_14550 [Bacteriovorax sp.]|nr:hypothetical protein [Bacteriovorax sp.]